MEDGDSWQADGLIFPQDKQRLCQSRLLQPISVTPSHFLQGMEGPGMDGPAWKRQRMDDGPGGPSRQDSVFYKTRMCHKCAFPPCLQENSGSQCIIKAWQ